MSMKRHIRTGLGRFLREPLVHLFALGACIYLAYGLAGAEAGCPTMFPVNLQEMQSVAAGFACVLLGGLHLGVRAYAAQTGT